MSSEQILDKFCDDKNHSYEVEKFAMMIFDGVNSTFKELSEQHRSILRSGALLHDIGYYIDSKNHNKHSQKLIMQYGLTDFSERQKEIVSCLARYHRGSLPDKKEHDIYCYLDKKERKVVKRLGGILKVADGIAHINFVDKIEVEYEPDDNVTTFFITPSHIDYRPDISYIIRKKDLFEVGFKTQAVFRFK